MLNKIPAPVDVIATDQLRSDVAPPKPDGCSPSNSAVPDPGIVHIVSLVVHVRPQQLSGFRQQLAAEPELEIHADTAQGKLVVVLEADSEAHIVRVIDDLMTRPGVMNVAMVYHEMIEDDEFPSQVDGVLPEDKGHDHT